MASSEQPPEPKVDPSETSNSPFRPLLKRTALVVRFARTSALSKCKALYLAIRTSGWSAFQPIGVLSILIIAVVTIGPPWDSSAREFPVYVCLAFGLILGFLLWKVPRERYSAIFASIFGWLPVTLGALSYPFWYWYASGQEIGNEFFHAAADILPVLLLATVIDVRRTNELSGKQLVPPIAAVFLGELAALNGLAFYDSDMTANFAAVSSSLVTSIFALVIAVMADLAPASGDVRKDIRSQSEMGLGSEAQPNNIAGETQVKRVYNLPSGDESLADDVSAYSGS